MGRFYSQFANSARHFFKARGTVKNKFEALRSKRRCLRWLPDSIMLRWDGVSQALFSLPTLRSVISSTAAVRRQAARNMIPPVNDPVASRMKPIM